VTAIRRVRLGPRATRQTIEADGSIVLRSVQPLAPYPARLTERLEQWAERTPDAVFLAKRGKDGAWRTLRYGETLAAVRRIGQALLDRPLSADRPIAILSGNDLEHGLLALAAQHVGVPYAPISPAYSLVSKDYGKLKHVLGLLTPGLVFAANGRAFADAIAAAAPHEAELVVTEAPPDGRKSTLFADLLATTPSASVERATAAVGPDTIAKFLFTSGSTGMPKGVVNTQRMLCSNQQMLIDAYPVMAEGPPVIVDWLPWNHTFGGNHNVGLALYNGGALYIDDGKPVAGAMEESIRNLREIAPTIYFNVPKGYEALVPYLRREPELRQKFFSRLNLTFYSAAGLSQHIWDALDEVAVEACGERILMSTGLGATETAPFAICCNWEGVSSGMIGLPAPGLELRLVPSGHKLEVRVKGPNVTPGYWRQPEATKAAFDEQGWYRMGDAARFIDPEDPQKGLMFDGRINEDFKLSTGTWVSVGPLKTKFVLHFAPYVRDIVVVGLNCDEVGALIMPDLETCAGLAPELGPRPDPVTLLRSPAVQRRFRELMVSLAHESTGSATRVARAAFMEEPPSIDAHEMTDKGSLNAAAVLARRASLVEAMYADDPPAYVMTLDRAR
jgi:feruloyl-CoA synthase